MCPRELSEINKMPETDHQWAMKERLRSQLDNSTTEIFSQGVVLCPGFAEHLRRLKEDGHTALERSVIPFLLPALGIFCSPNPLKISHPIPLVLTPPPSQGGASERVEEEFGPPAYSAGPVTPLLHFILFSSQKYQFWYPCLSALFLVLPVWLGKHHFSHVYQGCFCGVQVHIDTLWF